MTRIEQIEKPSVTLTGGAGYLKKMPRTATLALLALAQLPAALADVPSRSSAVFVDRIPTEAAPRAPRENVTVSAAESASGEAPAIEERTEPAIEVPVVDPTPLRIVKALIALATACGLVLALQHGAGGGRGEGGEVMVKREGEVRGEVGSGEVRGELRGRGVQ